MLHLIFMNTIKNKETLDANVESLVIQQIIMLTVLKTYQHVSSMALKHESILIYFRK